MGAARELDPGATRRQTQLAATPRRLRELHLTIATAGNQLRGRRVRLHRLRRV
jgi:hypothetical protein